MPVLTNCQVLGLTAIPLKTKWFYARIDKVRGTVRSTKNNQLIKNSLAKHTDKIDNLELVSWILVLGVN
jgi:hypothetical protein